jgi:alpha-1,3-rhamnosyl/mannosyltransferase
MRVGLDITQAVKQKGRGIANYIRQVIPPLENTSPAVDITLCIRGHRWWRRSLVDQLAPASPRAWVAAGKLNNKLGLDLFHSFGNHLPSRTTLPRTFTLHDFRSLDQPRKKGIGGDRLRRNIERAAGIICLTQHGRNRLLHHYPDFDADLLAVVPHGVNHTIFSPMETDLAKAAARQYGLEGPFVLQLGSWFPHKNLELSIRAFALSQARSEGFRLVFIGGGAKPGYRAELAKLTVDLHIENSVHWIENVSWQDIPGLVAAAGCLLQPSRYEGFAMPLLEAMATGTPGVVSNSSCLPEVSAGVWPIAGPDDAESFAAGIDAMTLDLQQRQAAVRAGLAHAAEFTWKACAAKTSWFFHDVLANN